MMIRTRGLMNNENTRLVFIVVRRIASSSNCWPFCPVKFHKLIPAVHTCGKCSLKKGRIIWDLFSVSVWQMNELFSILAAVNRIFVRNVIRAWIWVWWSDGRSDACNLWCHQDRDRQTARVLMFVPVPTGRLNPPSKKQYTVKFSLDS